MKLEVSRFGQLENQQTGKTILLIHPFPFDGRLWGTVAQNLGAKNYVLVPNLRGCGQTDLGSDEPDLNLLAEDLIELAEIEKLEHLVLAGISLGGYVAMALARIKPELISGLVLLDTKAGVDSTEAKENRHRIAAQMQSTGRAKVSLFAEQMIENVVGRFTHENRPQVVTQVKNWILAAKPETIAWLQLAMAERPDSFSTLATLNIPTLLIRGAQDVISSAQDFALMQKNLRQAIYVEIPNVGHLPPVEDPFATFTTMDQWLTTFAN